jgi:hypothetical protein
MGQRNDRFSGKCVRIRAEYGLEMYIIHPNMMMLIERTNMNWSKPVRVGPVVVAVDRWRRRRNSAWSYTNCSPHHLRRPSFPSSFHPKRLVEEGG